jgi:hypothetical protein
LHQYLWKKLYDGDSFTRVELSGGTVTERALPAVEDPPEDPSEDYSPVILAKRKWFVPYWDLSTELGSSVDDLRNPDHMCDCRKPMDEREHIDILTYDKSLRRSIVMATVTKTIGTSSRDYSTINAWEADLNSGTIYSNGDTAVGEMYADSTFTGATSTIENGSAIGGSSGHDLACN